ncbi:MAG: SAF domain-containing protein [Armatimonadetes bacterium]|nr:SAF domain-containing protein [Armatimonadota bacterium]MDW8028586.1 SAF domain-containing protein [Armatimonadota bacterium]
MKRRLRYFRLFILMTVILAVMVGIYLQVRGLPEPPTAEIRPVTEIPKRLVVAATDLMPRTLLTPDSLDEIEVEFVPEGAFKSKDEVINRLTRVFIRKGEPIFRQNVTSPLKEISAAYLIPTGQVGMALTVSRPETVPPLKAGDYISIHAVFAAMKVKTIVQRAMVLAVNNRIGEISLKTSNSTSQANQQTGQNQQSQNQLNENGSLVLFVALWPKEAKAISLAMDSGATFYYTLHSAPIQNLPFADLERDLNLQELTGSREVASLIIRKHHGDLPNSNPQVGIGNQLSQPMALMPFTFQLSQIQGSMRNLSRRVERLESQSNSKPMAPKAVEDVQLSEHRIIGIIGDQKVTFTIPKLEANEGKQK